MAEQQPELIPQTSSETSAEELTKREKYRQRLAEYLKDPAFRAIEGFPIGTAEDILALSDPPYYTACPNPFLSEIIEEWQQEREEIRKQHGLEDENYQREPFAADVSEGKYHPLYKLHPYPTKVPHQAIMRYVLHYTDPGDLVMDGFCGTGMAGLASHLSGDINSVNELGYTVNSNGEILEKNKVISVLGGRKVILSDLSTLASFISYVYQKDLNTKEFSIKAKNILNETKNETNWMYLTIHEEPNSVISEIANQLLINPIDRFDKNNNIKWGEIKYVAWSDVFSCPECQNEFVFWDEAVNMETGVIKDNFLCPNCKAALTKRKAERVWITFYDDILCRTVTQTKQVPVLINYKYGKKRFEKKPDKFDIALIEKIQKIPIPYQIPINPLPDGFNTQQPKVSNGFTHVHHFYTKRNLYTLGKFLSICDSTDLLFAVTRVAGQITQMYRFTYQSGVWGAGGGPMSGTLYIPSLIKELSIINQIEQAINDQISIRKNLIRNDYLISTQSSTTLNLIPDNSMDYIFIDPPFGGNLMYSELNLIRESWIKVLTNNNPEAIINNIQNKDLADYQILIEACFNEFFRILKLGHWITIEFHNSLNSVWISIQEALQKSGFVVADVRTLDKQKGTIKQVTTSSAVKQDLIISAYKPNGNLEKNFHLKAGTEDGAWEFVRYHLGKLPMVNESNGTTVVNAERMAFLLFDRMVAFHIQRGVMVPISSSEFYAGLEQRFIPRDGMYFLPDQVAEYDRAVLESGKPTQLNLFVNDEKTAITWLRQQLDSKSGAEPKTQGDLTNDFNRVMNRAKHEQQLELIEILKQNFLQDQDGKWYMPDHNKASDLEKIRQRTLLREFKEYTESKGRLKVFRSEAVRAGFADCFKNQDYETIIKVAERLPEVVLREDPDLLMYYDSALLRKG